MKGATTKVVTPSPIRPRKNNTIINKRAITVTLKPSSKLNGISTSPIAELQNKINHRLIKVHLSFQ